MSVKCKGDREAQEGSGVTWFLFFISGCTVFSLPLHAAFLSAQMLISAARFSPGSNMLSATPLNMKVPEIDDFQEL